ncbi:MAG: hypothetical protein EOO28_05285 [Comamonadaceae bacterium]|nr:MAG: hypothetical protein EOO28_05285 [Comamonadaceae bacterium]
MSVEHLAFRRPSATPATPAHPAVQGRAGFRTSFPSLFTVARTGRLPRFARAAAAGAFMAMTLVACGGGDGDSGVAAPTPTPPGPTQPETPAGPVAARTLLIDLDAATYTAVQAGIASGALPNLARLNVQPAYSGGVAGAASQQPTLDMPGWATLLTGSWASRHRVLSNAPRQAVAGSTVFRIARDKTAGQGAVRYGAAVASSGLAGLLSSDHEAGYLDTLTDCSTQTATTDCVTTQAGQMIASDHAIVLAQYRSAKEAALDFGIRSPQYAATLARLDAAVGTLVEATAKTSDRQWLVMVTGNHGLSANSQDDGLPLLPESTTFVGMNQPGNRATSAAGAAAPARLEELYAYASIADVAPTVLGFMKALPPARDYTMDGGPLTGAAPVSQLTATVLANNSADVKLQLNWVAPTTGSITVLRGGEVIAADLPVGTTSYVDTGLSQAFSAKGTYQLSYTVQAGSGGDAASRAILTPPISYVPPVPLAATLRNGLVSYYPFSSTLPPVDAVGNSTMAPAASDLPASAGLVVPGPFAGTNGLLVDTNFVTAAGLEGYRLTPATGFDIAKGTAPQFTLGFWFRTPVCVDRNNVTVISNKSYVSGGNAGVAVGLFASSGNQCGVAFNIGSGGGVRADGPTGPYTQITVDRWVYIAFSVDGVAKTMNMYTFDPVTSTTNRVAVGKSTGSVDLSKLSPYPHWGIGDDGTGTFLMNKCNGSVTPPYTAGKCATAPTYQQLFGDIAMWNRVLTDAELQSIFLSNKPLSTLPAPAKN